MVPFFYLPFFTGAVYLGGRVHFIISFPPTPHHSFEMGDGRNETQALVPAGVI